MAAQVRHVGALVGAFGHVVARRVGQAGQQRLERLRQAARLELRLAEAARLGFKRALIAPRRQTLEVPKGLQIVEVPTVAAAMEAALT